MGWHIMDKIEFLIKNNTLICEKDDIVLSGDNALKCLNRISSYRFLKGTVEYNSTNLVVLDDEKQKGTVVLHDVNRILNLAFLNANVFRQKLKLLSANGNLKTFNL